MKLFLFNRLEQVLPALQKLPMPKKSPRVGIIFNARDNRPSEIRHERLMQAMGALSSLGYQVEEIDLRNYDKNDAEPLKARLSGMHALFVGGGSIGDLCEAMHSSGFDDVITSLRNTPLAYLGESAGAVVCARKIGPFIRQETGKEEASIADKGLGLLAYVPLPHFDEEDYRVKVAEVAAELQQAGVPFKPIRDNEVIEENI